MYIVREIISHVLKYAKYTHFRVCEMIINSKYGKYIIIHDTTYPLYLSEMVFVQLSSAITISCGGMNIQNSIHDECTILRAIDTTLYNV